MSEHTLNHPGSDRWTGGDKKDVQPDSDPWTGDVSWSSAMNAGENDKKEPPTHIGIPCAKCCIRIEEIHDMMTRADATITKIAEQVEPAIASLTEHPLLKALTFGKKK